MEYEVVIQPVEGHSITGEPEENKAV